MAGAERGAIWRCYCDREYEFGIMGDDGIAWVGWYETNASIKSHLNK